MIRFSLPRASFVLFLAVIVAAGALMGHAVTAAGIAVFLVFLLCMEAKPAWKWFYDAPGDVDSGRSTGRFLSWRRAAETKPLYKLPRDFPGRRPGGDRRATDH